MGILMYSTVQFIVHSERVQYFEEEGVENCTVDRFIEVEVHSSLSLIRNGED